MKVSSTTALRVKTINGPLTTSSRIFSKRFLSPSANGYNFASVDLCKQMLARFGKVQPSFNISISLS